MSATTGGMEQLYQQLILDHARERAGYGLTGDPAAPGVGESFQVNPTCGDEVRLRVRVVDDDGDGGPRLAEVSWEGSGCSISQASSSVLTRTVTGLGLARVEEAADRFDRLMHGRGAALTQAEEEALGDAAAFVGVGRYPARVKCALLGWMALRDALTRARAAHADEHGEGE